MDQLIIGIISGIVATVFFSLFLLIVRPRIVISSEICKDPHLENVYRVKIVNKSRFILIGLNYSLYYCKDAGDGIKKIQEIPPINTSLTFLDKYTKSGPDDYAVRLSYLIDADKLKGGSTLEFKIMAKHSLSNTMCCKKAVYAFNNIKQGFFETGKSMKILIDRRTTSEKKEFEKTRA